MRETRDSTPARKQPSLMSRVMWFVGLWLVGVGSVAAVAYGIRLFIT